MIADRYVLVVRQERIVGPEDLSDIGGMVNADIEVGVVANAGRKMHDAVCRAMQQAAADRLNALTVGSLRIEELGCGVLAKPVARFGPDAKNSLSDPDEAASAASRAAPAKRPASAAEARSRIISPIAIPAALFRCCRAAKRRRAAGSGSESQHGRSQK